MVKKASKRMSNSLYATEEENNLDISSLSRAVKHPFFMAPAERAAARLCQQISESNALNRAIQINLVSEDEDNSNEKSTVIEDGSAFFQKRTKLSPEVIRKSFNVKLKKISSSDPPPFPFEFQLSNVPIQRFVAPDFRLRLLSNSKFNILNLLDDGNKSNLKRTPFAKILKETYSEIDSKTFNLLNSRVFDCYKVSPFSSAASSTSSLYSAILNETETNLSADQPVLWVFTGPNGVGKTSLVEVLAERLDLRLITIDSTQIPRNSKTFETLHTTLSHSTPKSFSQFFSKEKSSNSRKQSTTTALLFDEVEIAFESDRGYWSALSSFLQTPPSKSCPIFITSNSSISFLESIIKFPEHVKFISINQCDYRKFSINNDFIGRLHRIDTSTEYEHLAMCSGYYATENSSNLEANRSELLVNESLRWKCISIERIRENDENFEKINPFSYAEFASFSDTLISTKIAAGVKMNLDFYDNLNWEFSSDNDFISDSFSNGGTLLYSNIPEVYENEPILELVRIASECIGTTIKSFTDEVQQSVLQSHSRHYCQQKQSYHWKDFSKKLSKRFFDYTKSLQFHQTWLQEISSHVLFLELNNYESNSSRRRKRPFYRYLGDELLNEIILNNYNKH